MKEPEDWAKIERAIEDDKLHREDRIDAAITLGVLVLIGTGLLTFALKLRGYP